MLAQSARLWKACARAAAQLVRLDTANRYTLFLDSTEAAEPTPPECETRVLPASVPTVEAASANGRRSLADMWRMSRALSAPEFDLLLFPTIYSFVPVFSRARKLVMVHDIIAETYPSTYGAPLHGAALLEYEGRFWGGSRPTR